MRDESNLKNWVLINRVFDHEIRHKSINEGLFKLPMYIYVFYLLMIAFSLILMVLNENWWDLFSLPILLVTIVSIFVFMSWKYKSQLIKYDLLDLPYFQKFDLLHYTLFKDEMNRLKQWNAETIERILEWQQISVEKFETLSVFNSTKWVTVVIVGSASALFTVQGFDFKLEGHNLILALFLISVMYVVSYIFYDICLSSRRRDHNIRRFLKMFLIEIKGNKQ